MSGYNNNYQQGGGNYGGGEANSYYNDSNQQQQYGQPQGQQYGQNNQGYNQDYQNQGNDYRGDGPGGGGDGERGFLGAVAGAAAGGYGGAKFGGKATGHTKTSGIVGALAGAFAGSKLQNAAGDWREERHERKEEERRSEEEENRRRHDNDNRHQQQSGHRGGNFAGSFSSSARDIQLESSGDDWILRASCSRGDGGYQNSSINLSRVLGNDDGSFRWSSGSSSHSSGGGGGGSYTVQQGDTLRGIASTHGATFDELARNNGISNPDMIYPGQVLQLPGGGGGGNRDDRGGNFGASARNVRLIEGQVLEADLRRANGDYVRSTINLDERITNDNGTLRAI